MVAPAVVGIPWLASVLGSMLSGLVAFFARFMAAKWAMIAAVITALTALTAGLIATMEGLIAGVSVVFPGDASWGLLVPDNLTACVSAYLTARIAKWFYYWHTAVLQWKLF